MSWRKNVAVVGGVVGLGMAGLSFLAPPPSSLDQVNDQNRQQYEQQYSDVQEQQNEERSRQAQELVDAERKRAAIPGEHRPLPVPEVDPKIRIRIRMP